jgi:hypothetical protein
MNRTLSAALVVTASLCAASTASADTKSWTAVKKVIGKGDAIVISVDLAALRGTAAFKQGLQMLMAAEPDAKEVFDNVKSSCGFDIPAVLSDMTFVMRSDAEDPLMAFGLQGIDEPRVIDCIAKVAGQQTGNPAVKITSKRIGKLTEYSVKGEPGKIYAAWLAKDVMVFTEDPDSKSKLQKRIGGKGATGDLARFIGRATTSAPFWFAVAERDTEDGRTILGGHGKIELAGGVWKASGAVVMSKPAEAASMAAEGQAALPEARKEVASQSPELAKVLGTVSITASGPEVVISGSVSDADLGKLIPLLPSL